MSTPRDWSVADPLIFELWVLEELQGAGFRVARTPRSGDGGADGIAWATPGSKIKALVIQCKHVQGNRKVGSTAVREVHRALTAYSLADGAVGVVVTNANGFTVGARSLASRLGVRLVAQNELDRLGMAATALVPLEKSGNSLQLE